MVPDAQSPVAMTDALRRLRMFQCGQTLRRLQCEMASCRKVLLHRRAIGSAQASRSEAKLARLVAETKVAVAKAKELEKAHEAASRLDDPARCYVCHKPRELWAERWPGRKCEIDGLLYCSVECRSEAKRNMDAATGGCVG